MSHSVTITRTTTTSSSTAVLLNTGYLKTASGLLKLFQTILGAICIGLVASNFNKTVISYRYGFTEALFFLLVVTAFFITTTLLLISCLISFMSASMLPKTIFEVIYHVVAFALLLAAGIVLMVYLKDKDRYYGYDIVLAAAIICLVNCALYLFSTILAFRTYRGAGL